MRKRFKTCLCFLVVFCACIVFSQEIYATENEEISTIVDTEINKLGLSEVDYFLQDSDVDMSFSEMVKDVAQNGFSFSFKDAIKKIVTTIFDEVFSQLGLMKRIIFIAIFCGFLKTLEDSFGGKTASELGFFVCYIIIIYIVMTSFYENSKLVSNTTEQLITLLKHMIPCFITIVAFSGAVAQSAVMGTFIMGAASILSWVIQTLIVPFISITAMLDIANNISETGILGQLSSFLKKVIGFCLKGCAFAFMSICTLQKIGAAGVSGLIGKTAKSAISAVPVVGDIMSSAVEMAAGLTGLLRSSVAVASIVFVCVIVMTPVIKLLIIYLIYKISAALIEPISEPRLIKALSSAGDFTGLLMGAIFVVSSMFIFSTIILLTVV